MRKIHGKKLLGNTNEDRQDMKLLQLERLHFPAKIAYFLIIK